MGASGRAVGAFGVGAPIVLTAQQLEFRAGGIGASEAPALFGVAPFSTELDVWATKRRGPNGEIPPVQPPEPDPDKPAAFGHLIKGHPTVAGTILEDGIVQLYEHTVGAKTRRCGSQRHKAAPRMLATPDRLVVGERAGVEAKLVGHWMAGHWANDTLPDYVWMQCQSNLAVTGRDRWDVAALLEGSAFRIHRVHRDEEWIAGLLEVVEMWCAYHLDENVPPDPRDGEDLARFNRRRWAKDDGTEIKLAEHPELLASVEPLMRQLAEIQAEEKRLKAEKAEAKAKLEALCGAHKSMVCDFGRFNFASSEGLPKWKEVAETINGGPVPEDMIVSGEPFRRSQLYVYTQKKRGKR